MGSITQITDEQRAAIARGWPSSGLTQEKYAHLHGIRPRTLREYLRKYGAPRNPLERALTIIETAITDLMAIRATLHAQQARHAAEQAAVEVPSVRTDANHPAIPARLPADADGEAATGTGPRAADVRPRRRIDFFNDEEEPETEQT